MCGNDADPLHPRNKLVVNLLNLSLDTLSCEILEKGLNFSIAPKQIPLENIICNIESAIINEPNDKNEEIKQECVVLLRWSKTPKCNLSRVEVNALWALRKNKDVKMLALHETPLGCSSRMPSNLNVFMVFLNGSSQVTYKTSHSQGMHKNQSKIRLLTTNFQRFDNRVKRWRTYYVGRFIYKTITYKWIIITRNVLAIQLINIQIRWQLSDIK